MEDPSTERLKDLEVLISQFINERDWDQYHRPKDIAMALSIEASELMELYLWDRKPDREELEDEMGDIFFFLIDMAMKLDIDLVEVLRSKIKKNDKKYPVDLVKGKDHKYTKYRGDEDV